MTKFLATLAALALIASAGLATAQTTASPSDTDRAAARSDARAGSYWGVDTDGRRVDVQAPYGGNNQAQADAKEAPLTERLNDQALRDGTPTR